jgi:hypothetical protein
LSVSEIQFPKTFYRDEWQKALETTEAVSKDTPDEASQGIQQDFIELFIDSK